MGALSSKLRSGKDGRISFRCPGCGWVHSLPVGDGPHPRWSYNGDAEKPTFRPSILATHWEPSDLPEEFDDTSKDVKHVCHSFVTDGRIQFLGDCTHALAGQTVDLPDWEK